MTSTETVDRFWVHKVRLMRFDMPHNLRSAPAAPHTRGGRAFVYCRVRLRSVTLQRTLCNHSLTALPPRRFFKCAFLWTGAS